MKKILTLSAFSICAFSAIGAQAMTCVHDEPLVGRVKSADAIFIGVVLTDSDMTQPTDEVDRVADVQVKRVFKGHPSDIVEIAYLRKMPSMCGDKELYPLFVGMGEDVLFYAKSIGDQKYFATDSMGVRLVNNSIAVHEIEVLPEEVKKAARPWWDFFGWTDK